MGRDASGVHRRCRHRHHDSGGDVVTGADEIVAFLRETLGEVITVHHGHMPEIDVTSPTTATGIWALQDILVWPERHAPGRLRPLPRDLRKVDGSWLIASLKLTRLHMDFTGGDEG